MRTVCAYFLITLFCFARAVFSQEIVMGLSKNEIGITAFFDGSEILVFGAVKATDKLSLNCLNYNNLQNQKKFMSILTPPRLERM